MNRMTQELEAETAAGVFAEAKAQMNAHHQVDLNLIRIATERICREAGLPTPHQGWFSRDPDLRWVEVSGKGSDS